MTEENHPWNAATDELYAAGYLYLGIKERPKPVALVIERIKQACIAYAEPLQNELNNHRQLDALHRITCMHHTDAEREALRECPVCMKGAVKGSFDAMEVMAKENMGLRAQIKSLVSAHDECERQFQSKVTEIAGLLDERDKLESANAELQRQLDEVNNGVSAMAYVRKKQDAQIEDFRTLLTAANHALKSYAHGNSSPDLAQNIARKIDEALTPQSSKHPPESP